MKPKQARPVSAFVHNELLIREHGRKTNASQHQDARR